MGKVAKPRSLKPHQAMASQKTIKTSPQKLNLVAGLIRGKKVDEALNILQFSRKRVSDTVKNVLFSAVSNAENNHGLDIDNLYVDEASVGKAMILKRFHVRGRGRVSPVQRYFSNIRIVVGERKSV